MGQTRAVAKMAYPRQVLLVVVVVSAARTCSCATLDMAQYQHRLLQEHNEFRKLERASDMNLMKWNNTLAKQAANWVERCDFKHEMSGGVGENLAFDSNPGDPWDIMKSSVNSWHDEKRDWRYGKGACGHACHYTQMVWAATKQLGCAAKKCSSLNAFGRNIKNALYLVCYYYPRGNWIGEYPYRPGAPCSKCATGCTCKDTLCDDTSNVIRTMPDPVAAPIGKAYYRKTEFHSTGSKAPLKSLRVVQRGESRAWHWTSKGNAKLQRRPKTQSRWQTRTYSYQKPITLRELPVGKQKSQVIRSDSRSSRCIDRLPSCRSWYRQCRSSLVVQLSCLRTCNRCDSLDKVVNFIDSSGGNVQKPATRHVKNPASHKAKKHNRTKPHRKSNHDGTKRHYRRQVRNVTKITGHKMQYGKRISTSGRKRMFRSRKVETRRRVSPRRRQRPRTKGACSDDEKYADRCKYWHHIGYCSENTMMRQVFCKKTCGGCG